MSEQKTVGGVEADHAERENPLRVEKRRKLQALRDAGIDPFPHTYEGKADISGIHRDFESVLQTGEAKEGSVFKIAGRLMTKRPMGKAAFCNIQDQRGSIQCYLRIEELPDQDKIAF